MPPVRWKTAIPGFVVGLVGWLLAMLVVGGVTIFMLKLLHDFLHDVFPP